MGTKSMAMMRPSRSSNSSPCAGRWAPPRASTRATNPALSTNRGRHSFSRSRVSLSTSTWAGTGTWNIWQKVSFRRAIFRPSVSTRMPACMFSMRARSRLVATLSTISVCFRSVVSFRVPDTPRTTPSASKAIR